MALLLASAALSRATVILSVYDPSHHGVIVGSPSHELSAITADGDVGVPATVSLRGIGASLTQSGSEMQFGFSKHVAVDWDDWKAGTGYQDFGPVPILIRGTENEPAGKPVNLLLNSTFAGDEGYPPAVPSLQINGIPYEANGGQLIQTLKVGDTYEFGAVMQGAPEARGELIVDLFVSEEVGATPASEPATILLLGGGFTLLTVMARRRKLRKNRRSIED